MQSLTRKSMSEYISSYWFFAGTKMNGGAQWARHPAPRSRGGQLSRLIYNTNHTLHSQNLAKKLTEKTRRRKTRVGYSTSTRHLHSNDWT